MTAWRGIRLGDGMVVRHGFAFKGEYFRESGQLIVLTPGNFIETGGFKSKRGVEKYYEGPVPTGYLLERGDVVVAMTEQSPGLLGSSATIPENNRFLHNQRIGRIEISDAELLDLRFVYHVMNTATVRQQIQATATGAKVRHTAPERIAAVRVRVPTLGAQRIIASVLDSFDQLVDNNRRRIAALEEMVRAIYREWFVHLRFPGHTDATIVDSPFGEVPDGWRWSTCGDELHFIGGGTPSKRVPAYWEDGRIAWYTPSDLTKNLCRYSQAPALRITESGVANSSARRFPAGSVLMTSRATLGVLSIATTEATTNQGFIVVLPDDRWSAGFIREWLDVHAPELAAIATGATFKEITKGAFKRVPFLLPPQVILDAYTDATEPLEKQILNLERQVGRLLTLRDVLLPRLVSGQVDVSGLQVDGLVDGSAA